MAVGNPKRRVAVPSHITARNVCHVSLFALPCYEMPRGRSIDRYLLHLDPCVRASDRKCWSVLGGPVLKLGTGGCTEGGARAARPGGQIGQGKQPETKTGENGYAVGGAPAELARRVGCGARSRATNRELSAQRTKNTVALHGLRCCPTQLLASTKRTSLEIELVSLTVVCWLVCSPCT